MQGLERQLKRYRAFTSEQFLLLANYKHQKFDRRRLTKLKKRRACHTHTHELGVSFHQLQLSAHGSAVQCIGNHCVFSICCVVSGALCRHRQSSDG